MHHTVKRAEALFYLHICQNERYIFYLIILLLFPYFCGKIVKVNTIVQ